MSPARLLVIAALVTLAAPGSAADGGLPLDPGFPRAPSFAYVEWQGRATVEDAGLRIIAPNSRGGCGFDHPVDAASLASRVPALWVRVNQGSKARRLFLSVLDRAEAAADAVYQLPAASDEVVRVLPDGSPTLGELLGKRKVKDQDEDATLDLTKLLNYQFRGDWTPDAIDVVIAHVELITVDAGMEADRTKAARQREQQQQWERERRAAVQRKRDAALSTGAEHPADGATVVSSGPVAADIFAIRLQGQRIDRPGLQPYQAQAGDEVVENREKSFWEWDREHGAFVQEPTRTIFRTVDGKREELGVLAPDGARVWPAERLVGTALDADLVEEPRAYEITSADDPAYAKPQHPTAVHRKSKPNDITVASKQPLQHHVYLRLPSPMKPGASYVIRFKGLNTAAESISHLHDTTRATSEAVHAIHTGFRADDPVKRASLSIWLGTGGGYQHEGVERFELLDDAGAVAFTGKPRLTKAKGATEKLIAARDYAMTAVWSLDFSAFSKPGRYRVHVPGVGCSLPFAIAPDIWQRNFLTAMRGFLHQRNGIALVAPWSDIERRRPMHPDDGVRFFQLSIPMQAGQEGKRGEDMVALQEKKQLTEVKGVWGGYQDAGDWDTLSPHLGASELLLELAEMHPEFVAKTKLALPPDEAGNQLPDVLDEALWGIAAFRRLQLPDGSVRGGYGEGWGASEGQTSDMVRAVGVYAPDLETTTHYAAVAAKVSRLLAKVDAEQARTYRDSAVKAWAWAAAQPDAVPEAERRGAKSRFRAFAAVELYALTGEAAYRDAFLAVTELRQPGRFVEQHEASFTYARLPDGQADPELRATAVKLFAASADTAIAFGEGNAFGVVSDRPDMPMISWVGYFSTPGMATQNLPRAHFLTKDPRHLGAVVQACTYALGANPANRTYTVGVGHDWPRNPLHVDSRRLGHQAWPGITIYGCADETNPMMAGSVGWVHTWFTFGMTPKVKEWPAQESDLDIYVSASLCEYTVTQQIGPVAFYWGYLAGRP